MGGDMKWKEITLIGGDSNISVEDPQL